MLLPADRKESVRYIGEEWKVTSQRFSFLRVRFRFCLASKPCLSTPQQNLIPAWFIFQTKEKKILNSITDWADISYHEKYQQSGADYATVGAILTPTLAAMPIVFHVHLDQDALKSVLDAFIVEVVTFYDISEETGNRIQRALDSPHAEGIPGRVVHGAVVEELTRPGGNVSGKAYFAMAGLESRESQGLLSMLDPEIGRNELESAELRYVRFDN